MAHTTLPKPEWLDAKEAKRIFCIHKNTLAALAAAGKIRTSSLRERGKLRGKRLYSYDSIAAYIEARAEDANTEAAKETRKRD